MKNEKLEIMVSAGEVSGDLHGANLIRVLLNLKDNLRPFGLGGSHMEKAGVELIAATTHLSSIGIVEALGSIFEYNKILRRLMKEILRRRPKLVLLIDNQGFNIQLAKRIKDYGIPILYWFPPQIWAFAPWQAKKIAGLITHILAVFPFEEEAYLRAGAKVSFVGHPFVDTVCLKFSKDEAYRYFGLSPQSLIIGLLPGSRIHEIKRHLCLLLEAGRLILKERENTCFILPVADRIFYKMILDGVKESKLPVLLIQDHIYDALSLCKLLITASGSVTLEAAILKIPMVIIYKMSSVSWFLSRLFVKAPYAGMPNILAKKMIVPELLQNKATPKRIADEAFKIINDSQRELEIKEGLSKATIGLGERGSLERTARIIISYL